MSLSGYLGPLLGRAHGAHRALTLEALAPLEIGPKGFGALVILDAEGPLSQQQLGKRQGVDRTTTVAVVDQLERVGAVRRRRDEADRRAYAVEITPEGARLLESARGAVEDAERRFLAPLPEPEHERLREALRTLLRDAGDGPPTPREGDRD
jgi:DNA-binding MarR family transcriptional regulator